MKRTAIHWVAVAFCLTAAVTIALAATAGPGAAILISGAVTTATAMAGLVLEIQRHPTTGGQHPPASQPVATGTGTTSTGPIHAGRSWKRALPWLVLVIGLVAVGTVGVLHQRGTHRERGPELLGPPDFPGYCRATGQGDARIIRQDAYGWDCTATNATGDDATKVCAQTFGTQQVISVVTNFSDPHSWQCWQIHERLGSLDFPSYCFRTGHDGAVFDQGRYAYGWFCAGSRNGIDTNAACAGQYGKPVAIARFRNYYDQNSWECYA